MIVSSDIEIISVGEPSTIKTWIHSEDDPIQVTRGGDYCNFISLTLIIT